MMGHKKRILFIFLFVFCIAKMVWCDNQFSKGPESPFKVTISINEDSLNTDFYKKVGRFYVYTKVKNISNKDQEITVWGTGDVLSGDTLTLNEEFRITQGVPF